MDADAIRMLSQLKFQDLTMLGYKSRNPLVAPRERGHLTEAEEHFGDNSMANAILADEKMLRWIF